LSFQVLFKSFTGADLRAVITLFFHRELRTVLVQVADLVIRQIVSHCVNIVHHMIKVNDICNTGVPAGNENRQFGAQLLGARLA